MTNSINNPLNTNNMPVQGGISNYPPNTGANNANMQQSRPQIDYSKVLNPPVIKDTAVIKSKDKENKDKDKTPKTLGEKVKSLVNSIMSKPEQAIFAATTLAVTALLVKGQLPKLFKFGTIKDVNGLGKYVDELSNVANNKIKRIKINFPVERYQNKETAKRFIELTSDNIENLKAHPDRIDDVIKSINGTMEAIKRQPEGANQRIKIILGEKARGREKILTDIVKSGGIKQQDIEKYNCLLREVLSVETQTMNKLGFWGSRVNNPVLIEVSSHSYIQPANYTDMLYRWIEKIKAIKLR